MKKQTHFNKKILNLSKYKREHDKYYTWNPLEKSVKLQIASIIIKNLAVTLKNHNINSPKKGNPNKDCRNLNETSPIDHTGVLMECEDEPAEISQIKRNLKNLAGDFKDTGERLSKMMESSWIIANELFKDPELADILSVRHSIIINDWEAAELCILISKLINRAIKIFNVIDFTSEALNKDREESNSAPDYLYSASRLIDHAADLTGKSAILLSDNKRRWQIFRKSIQMDEI